MNTTGLFNLSWQRYLNLLFLLLTVGFLTSGVVTLIAANLDYFSDLAKIYGLQTLLVVTVVLGIYCFIRESRRQAKEKLKWKTYSLFFVVSVLIGGLFALVGQTIKRGLMYGSYLQFGHFANFHFYYYFRMWPLHYYLPPPPMLRFIYLMNKTRITQCVMPC